MIVHYQLFIPFRNNPLGRGTQLFATSFLGDFVHFIDRDIINKVSRRTDMLLARAVIWPHTSIDARCGAVNPWTVISFCRSSFHD